MSKPLSPMLTDVLIAKVQRCLRLKEGILILVAEDHSLVCEDFGVLLQNNASAVRIIDLAQNACATPLLGTPLNVLADLSVAQVCLLLQHVFAGTAETSLEYLQQQLCLHEALTSLAGCTLSKDPSLTLQGLMRQLTQAYAETQPNEPLVDNDSTSNEQSQLYGLMTKPVFRKVLWSLFVRIHELLSAHPGLHCMFSSEVGAMSPWEATATGDILICNLPADMLASPTPYKLWETLGELHSIPS